MERSYDESRTEWTGHATALFMLWFSAIIMVMPAVLENTISFSFVAFTFLQGWGLQRFLFRLHAPWIHIL
jgi:hypothetical protein